MILLSATLIVRNEAAVLPRCLASLRGLVDETIVVDTGSTDHSPQLAAEFGARVVHHAWQDDFAAARNRALSEARGRWILYIDADECAQPLSRDHLAATLDDPSAVAATVRFRSRTGFTRYRECRLFRNDPRIRFRHRIHESMLPDVEAVMLSDGARMTSSSLSIDHFGYDGDQTRKHQRNAALLRARLEHDPEHVYSWNHLGQTRAGLGDITGAVAAWEHAINIVRASRLRDPLHALPFGSLLLYGESAAAHVGLLDEALGRFPGDYLFQWLHGRRLVESHRWAEARPILEELASIDGDTFCSDTGLAYDTRIFGASTYEALGLCHFQLGAYGESARWYEAACAAEPDNPAHNVRRRLASARAASGNALNRARVDLRQQNR